MVKKMSTIPSTFSCSSTELSTQNVPARPTLVLVEGRGGRGGEGIEEGIRERGERKGKDAGRGKEGMREEGDREVEKISQTSTLEVHREVMQVCTSGRCRDGWADLSCTMMGPPPSWRCAFCSTPMRSIMAAALVGQWSSGQSMYWKWRTIRLSLICRSIRKTSSSKHQ